jgi:hypothetical protein
MVQKGKGKQKLIDPTVNYYEIIPKEYLTDAVTYPNQDQINIKIPSGIAILGPTGCSKTNFLLNFIATTAVFTRITLYAKNLKEPLYKWLIDSISRLPQARSGGLIIEAFDNLDEVIPATEYDENERNLVIFDDFMNESAKTLKPVVDMFSMGRKNNVTSVYIAQDYFNGIPVKIRRNINYLMIFKLNSPSDLGRIVRDCSKDDAVRMMATLKNAQQLGPRHFLLIDRVTNFDHLKYRIDYGNIYC